MSSGRGRGGGVRRTAAEGVLFTDAPAGADLPLRPAAPARAAFREPFLDAVFFFETGVFFFDVAFRAAVFFLVTRVRFFETDFFAVFFFDAGFFEVLRFLLTAGRFFRLAAVRAVLRTDVFFFDVFFLAAAFFAGIVALQDRLNETGDYTGARRERKA